MSILEINSITKNAETMLDYFKKGEESVDQILKRSNKVSEKVLCMWEYEKALKAVNSLTVNGERRNVILDDLQRENRQIIAFQNENRWLKEAVELCISTLNDVMEGHTSIREAIKRQESLPHIQDFSNLLPACMESTLQDELRENVEKMCEIVSAAEETQIKDNALYGQLVTENKVLKDMIGWAFLSCPTARATMREALRQIEELEEENHH
ncbi:unnamed protein product [Caenorhabditis auriculariae]|uniref:Uncharacterized protein n=1 Tax=Caenorhabditis auriculariae TaxID=2777116 RepID=A0A8S1GZ57_9PELO|nr:unnamed protein product [Caenorhabditis auriculariae]